MKKVEETKTNIGVWLGLLGVAIIAVLVITPSQFRSQAGKQEQNNDVPRTETKDDGIAKTYDIREDKENAEVLVRFRNEQNKSAAEVADIRQSFVTAENVLKQQMPTVKVEYNTDIRIPEVITPDVYRKNIEFLTSPSNAKRKDILRGFINQHNELVGLSNQQINGLKVAADYTNPDGNLSYVHFDQLINGIPVFRGELKAGFTKDNQIIRVINNLAPGLEYSRLSTDFRDPLEAVKIAAAHIKYDLKTSDVSRNDAASNKLKVVFGEGDWATTAEKMYFPTEPGVAVPAWRVLIWKPVNAYYVIVDAQTGVVLWHKNIGEDQTQAATYQIYGNTNAYMDAADSPAPLSPGPISPVLGTQGALINRTTRTIIGNEGVLSFNNNGWITDGTNITDGNATAAGVDRDTVDGIDATIVGAPNRIFDSTWNPAPGNPAPGDDPLTPQAQRGAVIQMFYVMNRYHDELYKLGFTEAARNFQASNFGRGGAEADRISAEGQDNTVGSSCPATPCVNNANFNTPADGGRGKMQMYVWNGPTPDYDGTTDAEVIIHEATHGTSNRLHGNASGLSTNMARGMGEGWSDFYSYTLLAEPTDDVNGIYTTGGYATFLATGGFTSNYYYGIRRFPRAPISVLGPNGKPHNPFTFNYINAGCATLIGTTTSNPPPNSAFPRGPFGVAQCDQVHNIGEIWSSMLWEVRTKLVTRLGFAVGNKRALQVVTDGMKLSPLAPNMLQSRDAIIAAAAALPSPNEASLDVADVREGFRLRGMGFSASIQAVSPAAVTEAFDLPNARFIDPFSVSDSTGDNDGFPEPGESVLLSIPVTNPNTGGPITAVQANVNGGTNVAYGTINDGSTVVRQIPYTVSSSTTCGALETVTINVSSSIGTQIPVTKSFRVGVPVGGAPTTFTNTTALTIPTTGVSAPYGTTITATGLSGSKLITLEVTGLTHSFPGDLDYLLVGPGGQKFSLLSDSGSTGDVTNLTFTLSDAAAAQPNATQWAIGDFKPVNITTGDVFAAPAPAAPYLEAPAAGTASFTSVFGTDGATMNGVWTLYVVDDATGDFGTQAGWKLTFGGNDYTCSLAPASKRSDFDGDGKTDMSVFRPAEGNWYLNRSTAGFGVVNFGISSDVITPGDIDGDGKTDEAVFRPSATLGTPDFLILKSSDNTVTGIEWGTTGDAPIVADYDGDNKDDMAVWRPTTGDFFVLQSATNTQRHYKFGTTGDKPVPADYNGDNKADFAVWRPSNGTWYVADNVTNTVTSTAWGISTDIPVFADYDGDGKEDIAVFRGSNSTWYVNNSGGGGTSTIPFGASGDVPVPGDYDGDGKYDRAVYRNGQWLVFNSSNSATTFANFGVATDRATPRAYLP